MTGLTAEDRTHRWGAELAANPAAPTPWEGHRPVWVQQDGPEEFLLECSCGGTWRRTRLADCAVAHERHQADPGRHRPDMVHRPDR